MRSVGLRRGASPAPPPPGLSIVGSTVVKAGSGSLAVNRPGGVVSGDLLLMVVGRRANGTSPGLSGWTLDATGSGAGNARSWFYSKVAGPSEPASYTVASGGHVGAALVAIRGATGHTVSTVSTSRVAPGQTAAALPAILLYASANAPNTTPPAWSPPTGMTTAGDDGDSSLHMSAALEALAATGSTGTRTPASSAPTGAFNTWSALVT